MGQTGDRGLGESGTATSGEVGVCADEGVRFRMVVAVDRPIARLGVVALLERRTGVVVARHGTTQSTARWLASSAADGAVVQLDTTADNHPSRLRYLLDACPSLRVAGYLVNPTRELMELARTQGGGSIRV